LFLFPVISAGTIRICIFLFKITIMKRYFISVLLLVFFALTAGAQMVSVLDKSDLQPIRDVTITDASGIKAVVTDVAGKADISSFSPADVLRFTHVSFQTQTLSKEEIDRNGGKVFLTENIISLDEFIVTANREPERKSDLPYKIETISRKDIVFQNPQTIPLMLEQTGNVFVQMSQLGGGSPVLRGFEANKVLLVVDGIRMNNAIYRAGHLQNAVTVDPLALSSAEVLYGPGSTLYGSDALGGVMNFRTREPILSDGKFVVHGDALLRYASTNTEKTGAINLSLGWKKVGVLLNFSYSDFDDLREGKVRNPAYGDWGKCLYYAERINGKDSSVLNPHPEIQKHSGYSQYNFLGKVVFRPSDHARYWLNLQYSNSSDVPRYDRLTEMTGSTTLKYAEWYYGPQKRLLASLNAEYTLNAVIFDRATFIVGYQDIQEDRINRKFNSSKKSYNLETVNVFSVNADLQKNLGKKDELRYGVEFTYNNVKSKAHQDNIVTGAVNDYYPTRYPDDKANMMSVAAYASNNWKINKVLAFSQGLRFSYVTLNAAYSDTMMKIMGYPFDQNIGQKNSALNGYLGLVCTPGHDWKFSLIGSTGFRAPNIDDLTKLSESSSTDQVVIVPNPDLKPEKVTNLEFSAGKTILGHVRLEGTFFYTWMRDAFQVQPTTYNGKDSIMFDGALCQVQTTTNTGNAYIYGVQASLIAQVTRSFSILSNLTYTVGQVKDPSSPLDHIPPTFGLTSFRLELKKFRGEFYVQYNGWKRMSQYSPSGEDNEAYATAYGTPAWYTLNLKASYQIAKFISVEVGIENIMDEHYRRFASGISSPGRNVIAALRATL
jgi:hemoglobin/transferrin/lactoferrin receptor protein